MLKNRCVYRILDNMLWFSIFFGVLFWIFESAVDAYLFADQSLIDEIFFPDTRDVIVRSVFFCGLAIQGFVVQSLVDRFKKIIEEKGEFDCQKSRESMENTARLYSKKN